MAALAALGVLDSPSEAQFDALVQAAALACGVPVAWIGLVDAEREWFKACVGWQGGRQVPRGLSFGAHAVLGEGLLEVPDAALDPRFADAPWLAGAHGIRFVAGAPLRLANGLVVGVLSVADLQPRLLDQAQRQVLQALAGAVAAALAGRAVQSLATQAAQAGERAAQVLAEQHEWERVALRSVSDAVITTDARGRVRRLNPVAERLTGWVSSVAEGQWVADIFHTLDAHSRQPAGNPVAPCLAEGRAVGLIQDTLLVSRLGGEIGIEASVEPIHSDAGEVLGAVLVFRDVSEQQRLSGEVAYRATHDALTGLVNRVEFEARLQRLLAATQADGGVHALLYIDLDQFKLVNDACGHAAGDQLLLQVGQALATLVRSRDTLARLGGDEFGIILENCSLARAEHLAQKLCRALDDFRFEHGGRRVRIGASIGLVPVDPHWDSAAAIQQAADAACYAAKEAGRNRVHAWRERDEALNARLHEMQWTGRIERALDDNRFELYAQRVVPLQHGAGGEHAEVLLRLREEDGSLVLPGAFLPAAEHFNLVTRIDRWVLGEVLAWMQRGGGAHELEQLSINLSGQSVGDLAFHAWALAQLQAVGPAVRRRLCLEITETAAVTRLAEAARFIAQVRALGVSVALDDFGAGASSFGYLKSLSVDWLKIDGRFIRDLATDTLDDVAVRCFVEVAKVMGLRTVAEFVDSPAVCERLRAIGVDHAQGHLVHRPEPIDELGAATWQNTVSAAAL